MVFGKRNLILTIAALGIIGGIIGLVVGGIWNPFAKSEERKIEKSFERLLKLDKFAHKINVKVEIPLKSIEELEEKGIEKINLQATMEGGVDKSDFKNPKSQSVVRLFVDTAGMSFVLKGEVRTFGKKIYVKIKEFPPLPFVGEELNKIKNRWFTITQKRYQKGDLQEEKKLEKEMKECLASHRIFVILKELGKEKLREETTFHYLVGFNKEGIRSFVLKTLEIVHRYLQKEEDEEYLKEVEKAKKDFQENFEEIWKYLKEIKFEAWIGKKDGILRKIVWKYEFPLKDHKELSNEQESEKGKFHLEMNFFDFNKEMEIEEPQNAESLEKFLQNQFPPLLPEK